MNVRKTLGLPCLLVGVQPHLRRTENAEGSHARRHSIRVVRPAACAGGSYAPRHMQEGHTPRDTCRRVTRPAARAGGSHAPRHVQEGHTPGGTCRRVTHSDVYTPLMQQARERG
eukprot:356133-Chlamydomonas_euryale.AAC.20